MKKLWLQVFVLLLFILFYFCPQRVFVPPQLNANGIVKADSSNQIIISEIMYDPGVSGDEICKGDLCEWFEIKNLGNSALDLKNFQFYINGTMLSLSFPIIDGDEQSLLDDYAIITKDRQSFLDSYLSDFPNLANVPIIQASNLSLTNSSGRLLEIKNGGNLTESISYDPKWGGGADFSLERNSSDLWCESLSVKGTPGQENSLEKIEFNNFLKLVSPAQKTNFIGAQSVKFEWQDNFNLFVSKYNLIIAADENFKNVITSKDLSSKSLTMNLDFGKYFWKIQRIMTAYDQNGSSDLILEESDVGSFSISPVQYSDKVMLNEIFPYPSGGSENEFIEIFNSGQEIVNLGGWHLTDGVGKFYFPNDLIINPGQYLVFYNPITKITLNNDGDLVSLYSGESIISQISYQTAKEDYSYSFGDNGWLWTSERTPGEENIFEEPVSEIGNNLCSNEAVEIKTGEVGDYIGCLVKISGLVVKNYSTVFYMDDGSGEIKVYFSKASGLDKSQIKKGSTVAIVGIVEKISGGLRVRPLSQEDIQILKAPVQETKKKVATKSASTKTTSSGQKQILNKNVAFASDGLVKGINQSMQKTKNLVEWAKGIILISILILGLILIEWRWNILVKVRNKPDKLPGNSP